MPNPLTAQQVKQFRHKVCMVAADQFAEKGVENVSMRSLAKALGYSATTLYNYFKNKDAILAAVRAHALNQLAGDIEQAMKRCPEPKNETQAVALAYLTFSQNEPVAYKLTFALDQPLVILYPELDAAQRRCRLSLQQHIMNMLAAGIMQGDASILSYLLWAGLQGLVSLQMANKMDHSPPFELLIQQLVELVIRGASAEKIKNGVPASGQQYLFDL